MTNDQWGFYCSTFSNVGTIADNRIANVSAPKDKEDTPGREPESQKSKRKKQKLIRLDDLIPKKDVKGGGQYLFGSSDARTTEKKEK